MKSAEYQIHYGRPFSTFGESRSAPNRTYAPRLKQMQFGRSVTSTIPTWRLISRNSAVQIPCYESGGRLSALLMLIGHGRLRYYDLVHARLRDASYALRHSFRRHATDYQPADASTTKSRVKQKKRTSSSRGSIKEESNSLCFFPASPSPARLLAPTSQKHHDVESYLKYATEKKLNKRSNVYKGTLYEYTAAATLEAFGFRLHRVGRSNDLGIDLVGHWLLPSEQELRVLAQCKAASPQPSMVRELAGASAGAPAGWRGDNVLAMLVCSKPFTKGAREAMQRSIMPVALVQVTARGEVKQLIWNTVAELKGLAGVGVTTKYSTEADAHDNEPAAKQGRGSRSQSSRGTIGLTWMGSLWRGDVQQRP